jgi:myo-inositol-1(or 4)-monophosphatase
MAPEMPHADLNRRLDVARSIVREAGAMAIDYFHRRDNLAITHKGAQDLVSEADRRCEEFIISRLAAAFPQDGFLGEEGGARNPGAGAIWVIDPIDGTHNFLTGIPFWCLSVGLVVDREAVLGVIYHPTADELFSARKGGGAFVNDTSIRVSGETNVTRARVCVGFSYRRPVTDHVRGVEALLTAGCEYLRLGSGALGLTYCAAGRFDGYWERHINAWDVAAGLALVREAGGWTNDFFAGDGLAQGGEVLAATPALVEPLARLTRLGVS